MLAIGRALVGHPDLLLLDEPAEGIQPSIIRQIERAVRNLVDELRLAVLIVEQNCRLIKAIADRCYVMETGAIRASFARRDYTGSDLLEQCLVLRTEVPASTDLSRGAEGTRSPRRE